MELTEDDLDFLSKHTACEREDLRTHFENFVAKHPNGAITRKDFRGLMKNCFPQRQDFDILEKRIFNMYDENRDGLISFRELMVVMYIMSNGTPEENLRRIFRVFDANGDGFISPKEMRKLVKDINHLLLAEDGGKKSKCKDLSSGAFREMDVDGDGKVTEEEFVKAVMAHEKIASQLALKIVQVFDPDQQE